jgi:hypothetical protein
MNPTAPPITVRELMREQGSGMRGRDGGLLRPLRLVALLGMVAAILFAPSALAATYTVDNATDATGQFCTAVGVGDCSLRSAIEHSNASTGTTDTINFDSAEYNGSILSHLSTSGLTIQDPVNIVGGDNCGPSGGVKPCVEVDNTSTSNNTFEIGANGVSISGIAFTGANVAINGNGFLNLTVKGSWFGVEIDGTTLTANSNGVSTGAGATGDTIGGTTAADRNVFSKNTANAITTVNGGSNTIEGNYIGTLPDGSAAASPGSNGILVAGTANGDTIGGDATNAGSCDGACNLIVGLSGNAISVGVGGPGPQNINVYGNRIGLGLNGTADQGNGGTGISVVQTTGAVNIGAAANTKRNYIAGNDGGGISTSQANGVNIVNNYVGVNAAGTSSIKNTTSAPARGSGILFIGDGGQITDNHLGGNGMTIVQQTNPVGTPIKGNLVGVGPSGEAFGITGESGLEIRGSNYQVGGTGASDGNTIGNVTSASFPAIELESGETADVIQGNFIGTSSTGAPEPNAGTGINVGGSNAVSNNIIGGAGPNVISNSGGDAIAQIGQPAGNGNQYLGNVGRNNGSGPNDIFIDLASDGPGNPSTSYNNGIQPPTVSTLNGTSVSGGPGSARASATVYVYLTYTSRGDVRKLLGTATAAGDGSWSFSPLGGTGPAGQCLTVNQVDSNGNSSELATPMAIGGGSCVTHPTVAIDSGLADGSSTNDVAPEFDFSSTDTPVTFECKVDSGSFSPCTNPFTNDPLADGPHTFSVRAVQAPSNPGLGNDTSPTVTRSFTVDTVPPVVSFTSGPAEGSSSTATSASLGFTANEPATFQCAVDGGSFGSCSSPLGLSGLTVGSHSVQVRGTDTAGNLGPAVTRNFSVQAVPPAPAPPAKKKCKKAKKGQASAAKKCKKKK